MKTLREKAAAAILELGEENARLRKTLDHIMAQRTGTYFICGDVGPKGEMDLPHAIMICPQYGSDGFAIYTKTTEYDAPKY